MSAQEPLSCMAGHLVNLLECVRRTAEAGRVAIADCQLAHIEAAKARLLNGDLRGADREQVLADVAAIFALKLVRMEYPLCERT